MNQLEAILESSKTGQAYRSTIDGSRREFRVSDGVLHVLCNDNTWVAFGWKIDLCVPCEMVPLYETWLNSLNAEDRESVELSQRSLRAWEACAYMAKLTREIPRFARPGTRLQYRLTAGGTLEYYDYYHEQWDVSPMPASQEGFHLILRDDLAEKLKEFGR